MKKAKKPVKRSAPLKATKPATVKVNRAEIKKQNDRTHEAIARAAKATAPPEPPKPEITVRTIYYDDQHLPALCIRPIDGLYTQAIIGDRVNGIRVVKVSVRNHDRSELTMHGAGTFREPYPVALFAKHMHTLAHNGVTIEPEARALLAPLVPSALPAIAPPPANTLLTEPERMQRDTEAARSITTAMRKAATGPSRTGGKELIRTLAEEYGLPPEKVRAKLRGAGLKAPYTSETECRKAMGGKK